MVLPEDVPTSWTLIDLVQQGNQDAWKRLIFVYEPLVRFWCQQWGVTNPNDLDDLLQDLWLSLGPTLAGCPRTCSFRAWLRGATYHKVQDWFRHRLTRETRASHRPGGVFLDRGSQGTWAFCSQCSDDQDSNPQSYPT